MQSQRRWASDETSATEKPIETREQLAESEATEEKAAEDAAVAAAESLKPDVVVEEVITEVPAAETSKF